MDDIEVIQAVNAELSRSEAFMNVRISYERALAYDYYYGREFGNGVDGRSRVVSADVAQAPRFRHRNVTQKELPGG